eukprot:TRINITY_DN38334_c0_g1_i1.p1 TRINITY_DN38334_c0_g1~~TRINITY_DN38334_c0_g1_i1.p1  ORF type:complete len:229 (-),score=35.67 TRINITY_DN38334_c0_g1_i1:75-761(-)
MSLFAEKVEKPVNEEENDGDDNEPAVEEESTAVFTPVVQLTEVEVKTMEEDEDILYTGRAKLFTHGESLLNKGTGVKSWNERGTGDVKFLKHKETSHIRVLMRQEKTMKIIINHFLDPRIKIQPNVGASDKSWVWSAFDFSDGENLVETMFAIRFKTPEFAQEFEKEFKAGQKEMTVLMAGGDANATIEEKKETDEISKAVENLGVNNKNEDNKNEDKKEEDKKDEDK